MKNFKRVLALVLSAALIVTCFAACAGNGEGSDSGEKVLKIGGTGPLTGSNAQYGNGVNNGAKIAVDEINAAGGINGVKIEFRMEDDEADPEKAVNAFNTLMDWGMDLSIGTTTSGACIAFQGEAKANNIFLLTPSATAVEAIEGDNAFRVCFSDPNQGIKSADYIADHKLATKVAIIYDSSDQYSSGIHDKFVAEAKAKGLEIVSDQAFTSESKTDFSTQLQAIKSSGAEIVFLPIYYSEASLILSQAKAAGVNVKFFGADGLDGILKIPNFDKSLAEGVLLLTPFSEYATDEKTVNFVKKYKDTYGAEGEESLNQFAANAYDAIYIIKAAAEKAGINADMSASEICDAMKKAMTEITFDGVTGTNVKWTADGEPSKDPKAIVIENSAYKPL